MGMDTSTMIFVFGSNRSGFHGAGAARYASVHRGAKWNVGEGLTGSSYALPTKGFRITEISLDEVAQHVEKFLAYAATHSHMNFQVTQVGCGLGGFTKEEIAPLFKNATPNCYFDLAWESLMKEGTEFWGTF